MSTSTCQLNVSTVFEEEVFIKDIFWQKIRRGFDWGRWSHVVTMKSRNRNFCSVKYALCNYFLLSWMQHIPTCPFHIHVKLYTFNKYIAGMRVYWVEILNNHFNSTKGKTVHIWYLVFDIWYLLNVTTLIQRGKTVHIWYRAGLSYYWVLSSTSIHFIDWNPFL